MTPSIIYTKPRSHNTESRVHHKVNDNVRKHKSSVGCAALSCSRVETINRKNVHEHKSKEGDVALSIIQAKTPDSQSVINRLLLKKNIKQVQYFDILDKHFSSFTKVNAATFWFHLGKHKEQDKWSVTYKDHRLKGIKDYTSEVLNEFNAQELANITSAFAKLGCNDKHFINLLKNAVEAKLQNNPNFFIAIGLANITRAFAKLECKDANLINLLKNTVEAKLQNKKEFFKIQELVNITWAFSRFDYKDTVFINLLKDTTLKFLQQKQHLFKAQELASTAFAFARFDCKDENFIDTLRDAIKGHLKQNRNSFNAQAISNIVHAYTQFGCKDDDFINSLKAVIENNLQKNLKFFNILGLTTITSGFAKFGCSDSGFIALLKTAADNLQKNHKVCNKYWSSALSQAFSTFESDSFHTKLNLQDMPEISVELQDVNREEVVDKTSVGSSQIFSEPARSHSANSSLAMLHRLSTSLSEVPAGIADDRHSDAILNQNSKTDNVGQKIVVADLFKSWESTLDDFDEAKVVTFWHDVAICEESDISQFTFHKQKLEIIICYTYSILDKLDGQNLSDIACALSKIGCSNSVFHSALEKSIEIKLQKKEFNAQELTAICWAFARLGYINRSFIYSLKFVIMDSLQQLDFFSCQELTQVTMAFAYLNHTDINFMHALQTVIIKLYLKNPNAFNPLDMYHINWVFSYFISAYNELLYNQSIVSENRNFDQELTDLTWSVGNLSLYPNKNFPIGYS